MPDDIFNGRDFIEVECDWDNVELVTVSVPWSSFPPEVAASLKKKLAKEFEAAVKASDVTPCFEVQSESSTPC